MRCKSLAGALLVLLLLAAMSLSMVATSAFASGNADFLGTWNLSNGGIFTVTGQSPSGACTLEPGGEFSAQDCQVSGDNYSLTVVDADSSYESYNTGTIDGNTLTGSFTDTNGTTEAYTGTRVVTSTATVVACSQLTDGTANYSCNAVVSTSGSGGSAPNGTVDWSVTAGAFSDSSCTLAATSASEAACSVVLTPTQVANETDQTVTADYQGNAQFDTSSATATIPAVMLTVTPPVTVDTYLDGSGDATFNLTLSRASNTPVTVDYKTQDGTGTDAAKAAEGDYKPTSGTITFAPGTTTAAIKVQCNADITLRHTSDFDLVLSNLTGATFPAATSPTGSARGHLPPFVALGPLKVPANIKPDLLVGRVTHIVDITTHQSGGYMFVERYDTHKIVKLRVGDPIYVGDKIGTDQFTVGGIHFLLGGEVGINHGYSVRVLNERSVDALPTGANPTLYHLSESLEVWDVYNLHNWAHDPLTRPWNPRYGLRKTAVQVNGGVTTIKG
jgi:hypothetical protein